MTRRPGGGWCNTARATIQRSVFFISGATDALGDWMQVRGVDPGPLFWPRNKKGVLTTALVIYNMLANRADGAGVKQFSPHDLRRTIVSDLLEADADIAAKNGSWRTP